MSFFKREIDIGFTVTPVARVALMDVLDEEGDSTGVLTWRGVIDYQISMSGSYERRFRAHSFHGRAFRFYSLERGAYYSIKGRGPEIRKHDNPRVADMFRFFEDLSGEKFDLEANTLSEAETEIRSIMDRRSGEIRQVLDVDSFLGDIRGESFLTWDGKVRIRWAGS